MGARRRTSGFLLALAIAISAGASCNPENEVAPLPDPADSLPRCADFAAPSAFDFAGISACSVESRPVEVAKIWRWTDNPVVPAENWVLSPPIAVPVEDTDGDGEVTSHDQPAVFAVVFQDAGEDADVVRIDGASGRWLDSLRNEGGVPARQLSSVAAGRLCANEGVSLLYVDFEGFVRAVDPIDFSLRWTSDEPTLCPYSCAILMADLDGNGCTQVIAGDHVYEATGRTRGLLDVLTFEGDSIASNAVDAFDVDGDGSGEILRVNAWYDNLVDPFWVSDWRDGSSVGAVPIGDEVDVFSFTDPGSAADPYVDHGANLRDSTGVLLWSDVLGSDEGAGGMPAIGDLDGDGIPEVVTAGVSALVALRADGTVLWSVPIEDDSSGQTTPTLFDFDGDGALDVAYADELDFIIVDGRTGATLYADRAHCSATMTEQPLVADLDGDGSAEVVVGGSASPADCGDEDGSGLTAYASTNRDWYTSTTEWPFGAWRDGYQSTNLAPVSVGVMSAGSRTSLRAATRVGPPDLLPRFEGWCMDGEHRRALVSVLNAGDVSADSPSVLLQRGGGTLATAASGVVVEAHSGYGPIAVEIGADDLTGLVATVSPSDAACSSNDEVDLPAP